MGEDTQVLSPSLPKEAGRTCLGSILKGGIVLLIQPSICVMCTHVGACILHSSSLHLPHGQCRHFPPMSFNQPVVNIWSTSVSI